MTNFNIFRICLPLQFCVRGSMCVAIQVRGGFAHRKLIFTFIGFGGRVMVIHAPSGASTCHGCLGGLGSSMAAGSVYMHGESMWRVMMSLSNIANDIFVSDIISTVKPVLNGHLKESHQIVNLRQVSSQVPRTVQEFQP